MRPDPHTTSAVNPIASVGAFKPDVMLIDVGLPVMDGYELVRRLRADAALASVRLIAVTGYGQESDRRRAYDAGFDQHLVNLSISIVCRTCCWNVGSSEFSL
jgi:CheY-like chemotaxis protein